MRVRYGMVVRISASFCEGVKLGVVVSYVKLEAEEERSCGSAEA